MDHKPQRPDENARISRTEARILSETALGIEGGSEDKLYVCRIHNGTIRYGVLFTRSIGDADAHANLGLSCKPEIKRGMLGESDRFLVIATDGVWDYMDEADGALRREHRFLFVVVSDIPCVAFSYLPRNVEC